MPSCLQRAQLNDGRDVADAGQIVAVTERCARWQHDILGAWIAGVQDDAVSRDKRQADDRVNAADQENIVLPILHVFGWEVADQHVAGCSDSIYARCRHLGCPEHYIGLAEALDPSATHKISLGRCAVSLIWELAKIVTRKRHSIRVANRARNYWRCGAVDQPFDGNTKGLSDPDSELRIRHGLRDYVAECPAVDTGILRKARLRPTPKSLQNARTPRRARFIA